MVQYLPMPSCQPVDMFLAVGWAAAGVNDKEMVRRRLALQELTNYGSGSAFNKRKGVNVHGDGFNHFLVKAAVYKVLQEAGHEVLTEVEFPNGYVADVIDLNTFYIYEVETDADTDTIIDKIEHFDGFSVVEEVLVLDPVEAWVAANEARDDDVGVAGSLRDWVESRVVL